jgi:hypothetical protein
MSDALQNLLGTLKLSQFPSNSRYATIPTVTMETSEGNVVVYLRRRFVPPPERFALLQEHFVLQGERLDNITARYFNDPERFWQICDANGALEPDELTATPGRALRITLPEGVPGSGS